MLYQLSYFRLLSRIEDTCERARECRCQRAYFRRNYSAGTLPIGPGLCDLRAPLYRKPNFRESIMPEVGFPRRPLSGNLVNS
jgi:hypothetical protein